ncbi:response regulator transcription factor [Pseudomonas sp. D2-3]|uniref:response regulator transcription factor n=1 Tax=Phytopseudomonas argentinensis TaxID=289370 RepID=UPI0008A99959|nr:response regulator transcription factor [Pseudomonas argentinensis]
MNESPRILVIDDEKQIRKLLRISLATQSFTVLEAATGAKGLTLAAIQAPHLVILDLGLPDMDGSEVLRELRAWSEVPVLVLSVRNSQEEKVRLLDLGANDYVTKPFGIQEFMARVRGLLRASSDELMLQPAIRLGQLYVDLSQRLVTLRGVAISLSRKEYGVLEILARNHGRIVTAEQLIRLVWGPSHLGDSRSLRTAVGRLRQKFQDDPGASRVIQTIVGVGYRLIDEEH